MRMCTICVSACTKDRPYLLRDLGGHDRQAIAERSGNAYYGVRKVCVCVCVCADVVSSVCMHMFTLLVEKLSALWTWLAGC